MLNNLITLRGFRFAMVQAIYKSNDKHADVIYKRQSDINSDAKNWTKITIEELQNAERERFWMVFEETRRYREQSLTSFDKMFGLP